VQEFRKVITEAEKAAAAAQKQPPATQQKTP